MYYNIVLYKHMHRTAYYEVNHYSVLSQSVNFLRTNVFITGLQVRMVLPVHKLCCHTASLTTIMPHSLARYPPPPNSLCSVTSV